MKVTKAILDLYNKEVSPSIEKNISKFKTTMTSFIEKRSNALYSIAPYDRIYFTSEDEDNMFKALNISRNTIRSYMDKTYFAHESNFAQAAKSEMTMLDMCIIRHFFMKNKKKELELALIHLCFSGKFYPSIHYGSYPKVEPVEHVMLYVVNNCLTNKFDIKTQGSVLGAIKNIATTWVNTYSSKFRSFDDEDVVYLIQQLHNRIKSFMKNIASEYYKVYEKKDVYMTYDSDSMDADSYRIADSDSLRAERIVEKTMTKISGVGVNYKICKMSSNEFVKVDELRTILESILSDRSNLSDIKELIGLLVTNYFSTVSDSKKDVTDISFISYSIAPKPNVKNKDILRQHEIIEKWLTENSNSYIRRKSRAATKSAYFKALYSYFTLIIHESNK